MTAARYSGTEYMFKSCFKLFLGSKFSLKTKDNIQKTMITDEAIRRKNVWNNEDYLKQKFRQLEMNLQVIFKLMTTPFSLIPLFNDPKSISFLV